MSITQIKPEDDGILKDGQMIRFRPMMMDHQADAPTFVADHHRPHSLAVTDEQRKAAEVRVKAHDAKLSNAWRNPPPMFVHQDLSQTPPEVTKPVAFGEGKAVNDTTGLDALQAANERKYAARVSEMWRHPTNQGVR